MNFGKYTLLDRISHGGMAEVFRAKTFGAAGFERIVAIKLLLPEMAMDQEFVTMLIDEAKIAGQLSHANIAQIFDLGMVEGRYYIVQEYVSGLDLRKILRRLARSGRHLSVAQAVHIILKACEGLEYAHNKRDATGNPVNLVHRDVSPQNILISSEGEIKLIDFGIAKAEGRATRTLAGLVKGKFAYMSPEQIRGLPVDRRSDVFATGIVLHELLTNKPLFKRKSEFETLKRARSGIIDAPSKLNPDVPSELDEIVLHALARHVEDRYPSSLELRDALWQFSRSSGNFYSRNELAAWMADEIAEEDVTNTGQADSGDFPLIEVSGPGPDSQPTVVDLSGDDRDSAELSGEVTDAPGLRRIIVEGHDRPSVEISSEAIEVADEFVDDDAHTPFEMSDERPTLLFESGAGPLTALSQQMTAEHSQQLNAPPAALEPSQRMTAQRPGQPTPPPAGLDVAPPTASPTSRPTLLAASAPIAAAGPRHPNAPTSPPAQAPASQPPAASGPFAPPPAVPMGSAPPFQQQAGSHPGFAPGFAAGPTRPPLEPTIAPSEQSFAYRPREIEETGKTRGDGQPGKGGSRLLLVLAMLVLLAAIGVSITLAVSH